MNNENNGSGQDPNGNGNGNKPPQGGGQRWFLLVISVLVVLTIVSWISRYFSSASREEITYDQFIEMLDAGKVEKVVIEDTQVIIYEKLPESETSETPAGSGNDAVNNQISALFGQNMQKVYYTARIEDGTTITNRLLEAGVEAAGVIPTSSTFLNYFTLALSVVVFFIFMNFLLRKLSRGDMMGMGIGKSNAKVYAQKDTGITFADVAGEDEAIESLKEVVDFLHNPQRYVKIGARLPKGALLVGPPGTGKTLLAKAVAGEAHVPFYSLTGSDFVELYVGVGASRVRDLFKEAEKNAPCIIFIDEIDAIGRSRDSKYGGGNEEREQTLNQLLSEMDGFDGKKGIIILAATNRPEVLDKALLRPGRFDRRIIVEKPDLKGRVAILKVHSQNVLMDETVDMDEIALATSGAVGSDLANMINEAAINAVKEGREFVGQKDLLNAVEIVLVGKEKKDRILSKEERRIVSYHEVGHALVSALQKNSEPVQKITIIPRTMGTLGYVMHLPEKEKYLNSEAELRDRIVVYLAGHAAESLVFDSVTNGANSDIESATGIARAMVTQFGMSERFGLISLVSIENRYLDGRTVMNCADNTAAIVDEEVMKILKSSYETALQLLEENRDIMDKLAAYLIEKETITGKEFMEIYCREKGIPVPVKPAKEDQKKQEQQADPKDQEDPKEQEDSKDQEQPKEQNETEVEPEDESKKGTAIDYTVTDDTKTDIEQDKSEEKSDKQRSVEEEFAETLKQRIYGRQNDDDQK